MTENSMVIFTRASQMLAEANTIQQAKELKDLAITAAEWAKRKGMGEEAIQYCRSYALEAEKKMGIMLKEKPPAYKPGPGRGKKGSPIEEPPLFDSTPTLEELGLTKKESAQAQKIAELPEDIFEEIKAGTKTRTQAQREVSRAKVKATAKLPSEKYRIVYADPPWKYGDTRSNINKTTGAEHHYPTMSINELCDLSVADMTESNAVLFLWVTSPLLEECFPVIKAWGFSYKTSFVWDKVRHNMGHYNSVRHEFLLICTKGSCLPDNKQLFDSVITIEKTRVHSEKPIEFRDMIDTLYTYGKRIELFARKEPEGQWETWGNQTT